MWSPAAPPTRPGISLPLRMFRPPDPITHVQSDRTPADDLKLSSRRGRQARETRASSALMTSGQPLPLDERRHRRREQNARKFRAAGVDLSGSAGPDLPPFRLARHVVTPHHFTPWRPDPRCWTPHRFQAGVPCSALPAGAPRNEVDMAPENCRAPDPPRRTGRSPRPPAASPCGPAPRICVSANSIDSPEGVPGGTSLRTDLGGRGPLPNAPHRHSGRPRTGPAATDH